MIKLGLYEAHCESINKELGRRADALTSKALARISAINLETNKQICGEYDQISQKALTTPSNTAHLVELKAYVEKAEKDAIPRLEKAVNEARIRLEFLVENVIMPTYVVAFAHLAGGSFVLVVSWLLLARLFCFGDDLLFR